MIHRDPSPGQLQQFAFLWCPVFCGILGVMLYRHSNFGAAGLTWAIGAIVAAAGLYSPVLVKPVFVGLLYLTAPVGWVVANVVLVGSFYLVLTPLGLALRLWGHDPLRRNLDLQAATYWQPPSGPRSAKSYFKQHVS